jgi:hypothetical protein
MLQEGIEEGSRAVDIYKLACSLANKFPVNTEAGRLAVETMMIRFNAEKVRPPMELEGPNSLLMHTRRAIDYVLEHPKTERLWPGLQEWANKSQEESSSKVAASRNLSKNERYSSSNESEHLPGTIGGRINDALHDGDSVSSASNLSNIDVPKDPDSIREDDGGTPGKRTLTDVGNGRRLVDSYQTIIRYTPGLGWFSWTGRHWEVDVENLALRELSKQMASSIASEVVEYDESQRPEVHKWANLSRSSAKMDAALRQAKSDLRVRVPVDAWDTDPHLLGVKNGVVDLRTGELLKGRPELRITRCAPVDYTPGAYSKRWIDFIDFATRGDKELQEFVQRLCGYTITGLSHLDILPLVHGHSGSGKNTFVEAIVKALGTSQLSWPMDSSILADKEGHANPADLYHWAELRGRRMVWADELPDGERVKENSIKKLTGSSEISARSPGEKPFTFQSQAKLWITTNHKPIPHTTAVMQLYRQATLQFNCHLCVIASFTLEAGNASYFCLD